MKKNKTRLKDSQIAMAKLQAELNEIDKTYQKELSFKLKDIGKLAIKDTFEIGFVKRPREEVDELNKECLTFESRLNLTQIQKKPQLHRLCLYADNLPLSWAKIVKVSAADYEDRINELWGAGNYRSAKWNQKLAWFCALSNLGHYLWLKAWKPVSTVFRRLL